MRTSVGRRLGLLVIVQVITSIVSILLAFLLIGKIVGDEHYMYRFQLRSIAAISDALEKAGRLQGIDNREHSRFLSEEESSSWKVLLNDLNNFEKRYRTDWWSDAASSEYAKLFRRDLHRSGQSSLIQQEDKILNQLSAVLNKMTAAFQTGNPPRSLAMIETYNLRETLSSLLAINTTFASIANEQVTARASTAKLIFIGLGTLACVSAMLFGMAVHQAIAPRIQRLVEKVQKFKEGVNERVDDPGSDEIAILANALNVGFDAIADREKEREKFMAIAAHELKTPVTSIHGFVSYIMKHKDDPQGFDQALDIVYRQSWRLSRLIEDLFIVTRANTGTLRFQPSSVELSQLVKRVANEIKPILINQSFEIKSSPVFLIGDETLLAQGVWSLLTYSASLAPDGPVKIYIEQEPNEARVRAFIPDAHIPQSELNNLMIPFQTLEFEGSLGTRTTVSLYLCNEIAKLHHGHLDIENNFEKGVNLILELPA